MTNPDSILKSRDITLPTKGLSSQSYGFSSSHVWIWELDYEESWVPKNWCFWTVVLEKTLESPLDSKEIQLVHSYSGNQSWIFIGRLMLKLKLQYFGNLMQRNDSFEKTLMLGKTEGKGRGDDRGWDGWMGSPMRQTWIWVSSKIGNGQGGLACCSPWGRKELDMTEWLNWTELRLACGLSI